MIFVEIAQKTLEEEFARLETAVVGPNSKLWARGAMDAIDWLLYGGLRPSERGPAGPGGTAGGG